MQDVYGIDWKELKEVIVYGFGEVGKKYIDLFHHHFRIKYIVDNGAVLVNQYHNIPVITLKKMLSERRNEKIIVFASRYAYFSISKDLKENGLLESIDFCKFDDFLKDWYWQFEKKNILREVHMSVNTNCTFNCKKCNMFMPYYDHAIKYSLEEVVNDLDLFFKRIDFVFVFSFLGGEPFLNFELGSMIKTLHENYGKKVGRIEIITNGSIVPHEDTLRILKNCSVMVRISDYSVQIPYEAKLNEVKETLDSNGIPYCLETSLRWTDFCFPENSEDLIIHNVREHMLSCAPEFHGLNDGKFYYCHVAWSAEKAGLFQLRNGDYLNLKMLDAGSKEDCRKIIEHANGNIADGYVSLCAKCMGCGIDNDKYIPAGEQAES